MVTKHQNCILVFFIDVLAALDKAICHNSGYIVLPKMASNLSIYLLVGCEYNKCL